MRAPSSRETAPIVRPHSRTSATVAKGYSPHFQGGPRYWVPPCHPAVPCMSHALARASPALEKHKGALRQIGNRLIQRLQEFQHP